MRGTSERFKAAARAGVLNAIEWISKKPTSHVKNRYPFDSMQGCEFYAYFDKYMITVSSFFCIAGEICDESIPMGEFDTSPSVW